MNQTVYAAQVHECTEVDDGGHDALADLALLELVQEFAANLGLSLLQPCAARQDHVVAVLVELDDLGLNLLADVRLEVADATHFDERSGEEATKTDVKDEAALDDLDDGALDGLVLLLELLDGAPGTLVLSALLRQDQSTFFVLLGEDESLDRISHGDDLIGVDVVLDGELTRRDDAFGLVTDVEQNLVAVDLDDGSFDDVAIVEVLDRGIDGGEEVLGGANVVNGNLRRGDGCGGHMLNCSGRVVVG